MLLHAWQYCAGPYCMSAAATVDEARDQMAVLVSFVMVSRNCKHHNTEGFLCGISWPGVKAQEAVAPPNADTQPICS